MTQAPSPPERFPGVPVKAGDVAKLVEASVALNTRRTYQTALRQLDEALDGAPLTDDSLAAYLTARHNAGASPATLSLVVAAANFRERLRSKDPRARISGPLTKQVLSGAKSLGSGRGRGQAPAVRYEDVLAMQTAANAPRRRGRRRETVAEAQARGLLDRAMIGLAFLGGLRRSEIAALTWGAVTDGVDPEVLLVRLRRSKTNQHGERPDVRVVIGPGADALRLLRAEAELKGTPPDTKVIGLSAGQINRRLKAAAAAAGLHEISAHSFRVGLASELTARGASTTETMLAGGWQTARMVAHYSSDAQAERGAVAKHFRERDHDD